MCVIWRPSCGSQPQKLEVIVSSSKQLNGQAHDGTLTMTDETTEYEAVGAAARRRNR